MKLLSDNPRAYADAALEGISADPGRGGRDARRGADGHDRRHQCPARAQGRAGRAGDHRAALATRLRIGTQARPDIFARHIVLPTMLYETVVEIDERVGADGAIVRPLDEAAARAAFERLRARWLSMRSRSC